ncbi:hypothetical protein ACFYKX_10205 [Cytobacillus sp. FJAT-54145]|uniref:Uncharacterized protein n=1 Tax=Cytobacillus spartinae TaxID=3299023 RepID=A0ABW6KB84_9BACI
MAISPIAKTTFKEMFVMEFKRETAKKVMEGTFEGVTFDIMSIETESGRMMFYALVYDLGIRTSVRYSIGEAVDRAIHNIQKNVAA